MEDKIISLRLNSNLYAGIKKIADNLKLNVSQVIRATLKESLRREIGIELTQLDTPLKRYEELEKWFQNRKKKADKQFKEMEEELKKIREKIKEEDNF